MRLDTPTTHRFACCVASYGYMGDLMAQSETLRWMGPTRYNIAGAFVLFRGRAYNASVSYLPAPALARSDALCTLHSGIPQYFMTRAAGTLLVFENLAVWCVTASAVMPAFSVVCISA